MMNFKHVSLFARFIIDFLSTIVYALTIPEAFFLFSDVILLLVCFPKEFI